jgi:two-component system KDP operon response regulator KdpE
VSPIAPVVLIVEDDPPMRKFLRTGLGAQGFLIHDAATGERGIFEARARKPDLIILDLGLPDMDGIEVVKTVRGWSQTPIIILSARSQESQKIEALDSGADDYLTKPFSFGELLARIRVALRHTIQKASLVPNAIFSSGKLRVDLGRRVVTMDQQEVHLTPIQYRLLSALVKNSGKVMTHRQLMRAVWGPAYSESVHYLRIYMSQLRHKLESDPAKPGLLLTESGVGYRLVDPNSVGSSPLNFA